MKFDISRCYSAINADELRVGDKVIVAQHLGNLKYQVSQKDYYVWTIKEIKEDTYSDRFVTGNGAFPLAYLIERKKNCTNCGASPCGYRANHDIEDNKINKCPLWFKPKINRNLCDSCKHCFADCTATPDDVIFGDGVGNDNVCVCDKYEQKAEKHYRPFRDVDELIKVWCEHKCPAHNHREKGLTMPLIWIQRKGANTKGQLITEFGDDWGVGIGRGEAYNMTDLLVYFTFLDGTPCGVEE